MRKDTQGGVLAAWSLWGLHLLGAALTLLSALYIGQLQSMGRSAAAIAMSDMNMRDMSKYWAFPILQATGLVALLFSYFSALLGLAQLIPKGSGFAIRSSTSVRALHRHTSLCVIVLILMHMLATTLDAMGDNWKTVLIPGTWVDQGWPDAAWGYNFGIFASWLLILLAPTYYLREFLSIKGWRYLHRLIGVFYIFSVLHAMILGVDVEYYSWIRPTIWLAQIPLLLLLINRLSWSPSDKKIHREKTSRFFIALSRIIYQFCIISILLIVIIVTTGKYNLIRTV